MGSTIAYRPQVLPVHIQLRMDFPGGRHAEPTQEGHRHPLADHRRISGQVVENQCPHPEELPARAVVREVHFEAGLYAVAAAKAAGPDSDVPYAAAVPGDVGGVEIIAGEIHAQRLPVARMDRDLQRLNGALVEEIAGRLRVRWSSGCGEHDEHQTEGDAPKELVAHG